MNCGYWALHSPFYLFTYTHSFEAIVQKLVLVMIVNPLSTAKRMPNKDILVQSPCFTQPCGINASDDPFALKHALVLDHAHYRECQNGCNMDYVHLYKVCILILLRSTAQLSLLSDLHLFLTYIPLCPVILANALHSAQHRGTGSDKLKRSGSA
jgi:hypothetical protein